MEWNLFSSPPWVPFYPYTWFQNPIHRLSCQKSRETHHNLKSTCHTNFSHSALQLAYPKTYMCRFSSLSKHFFPLQIDFFFIFFQGELRKQPKISHFVDFDLENASEWLKWCIFSVWGMPNPMVQVSSLYNKWFLKNQNFSRQVA